jgi:hypothetical protein
MQITYGNFELDTALFPPATVDALIRRGVSHILGNEASSKAKAWEESENASRAETAGKAGQSTYNPVTDEEKAAKKAEFQAAFVDAMTAGTLGQGAARGPRVDPVEAAARGIAKREIADVLRGVGLKLPKTDAKVKFTDGQEFTLAELIDRRLEKHGERITREAQKHVADLERRSKKAREEAAKVGTANAEALGL